MSETVDYNLMMEDAMRWLMGKILSDVARDGLKGDNHLYITFKTTHAGVELTEWLMEKYPEEMTIVIQHWYQDLIVSDDKFEITLNFGNAPQRMVIPFTAVETFVDPSVEFGLRFEVVDLEIDPAAQQIDESPMIEIDADDADDSHQPTVISLDQYRR